MTNFENICDLENCSASDYIKFQAAGKCLKCNIPFALFALPGENLFHFFSNPTGRESINSFIISPWLSKFENAIRIYEECDAEEILRSDFCFEYAGENTPDSTDKNVYLSKIKKLIDNLKENNGKTVISRIIAEKDVNIDYISLAKLQFDCYPNTFRFLYFTPQTGAWLGTSPELLFDYNKTDSTFSTMSLAGTRKQDDQNDWDTKNILEQNFVAKYIAEILNSNNVPYSIRRSEDVSFYPVCHICDIFTGKISKNNAIKIINSLNPTPALGGFPLNDALKNIKEIEEHSRKCYGGYIGVEYTDKLLLYVNLRSMTFSKNSYAVYCGGGITENSIPEQEWIETENKCVTLLGNIEKCKI